MDNLDVVVTCGVQMLKIPYKEGATVPDCPKIVFNRKPNYVGTVVQLLCCENKPKIG
jgi:hypothetical protein